MKSPLRISAAIAATIAVACGGLGWLYLLRAAGGLDAGPPVAGALPLQRLAGGEAEPLARVLVAWLAAGAVEAVVLAQLLRTGRSVRAALAGTVSAVTLIAAGALSDAVTASEPIRMHVLPQLSRAGLWLAVATLVACALIPAPAGRGAGTRRRGADAGAAGAGTPRPA
jgi:hypothetical protein